MTKFNFKFWLNDEVNFDLVKWLKELTAKEKMSSTIIEILEFVRKNGLENLKSLEALKRDKLVAEIADLKSRTTHRDRTEPYHRQEKKPLTDSSYVPPEERKMESIIENNWNKFVDTLRTRNDGWIITCKLCSTGFPHHNSKPAAIHRFKQHLRDTHEEELLKTV